MIRTHDHQEPLFYTAMELSPPSPNSFYCRLNAAVGDWRALARPLEAAFAQRTGRPTDPVVYLKLFLIGYLENLTYDTELAERIDDSRALRHFLGYTLTERTPDHSSISRVRQRLAAHDLTAVLAAVVALCTDAGLVTGEVTAVDASLLRANASRASFRPKTVGGPVADHMAAAAAANPLPETTPVNHRLSSTTDPDARLKSKGTDRAIPSYQLTHVTDGEGQIILAATVAPADSGEAVAAIPALTTAQVILAGQGCSLQTVLADAGYDSASFQTAVEQLNAIPLTAAQPDSTRKPAGFRKADFSYDAETDAYLCPQGQRLPYKCTDPMRARRRYLSDATVCADCPCRTACLSPSSTRRWISRSLHESLREAVATHRASEDGRKLLARRKAIVEAPFGHLKTYGGLGRLNCRGLRAVRVKCLFAAVAWNLIRLLRQTGANLQPDLQLLQRIFGVGALPTSAKPIKH